MLRFLSLLLFWLSISPFAQAQMQELRTAQVTATVPGETHRGEVALPYYWDKLHSNRSGSATFSLTFSTPSEVPGPYGLFFPRIGNTAEVWLNDFLVLRLGDVYTPNLQDHSKSPQFILIPEQLLRKNNQLRILIHADGGRRGGLSSVIVGPEAQVRSQYLSAYRWQVSWSFVVAMFSLVIGVMALVLWVVDAESKVSGGARRDGLYLSAAVAEFCWALRLSDAAWDVPPLAWPWWELVQISAYAGWICSSALFFHQIAGWHRHASMKWVQPFLWILFLTAAPASYLSNTRGSALFLTVWLGFVGFLFLVYGTFYFWQAVRWRQGETRLIGCAVMLNVLVGLRDWMAIRVGDSFDFVPWLRFSSPLIGLVLGYIVLTRFRAASRQARDLMTHMAERVAEKEQALAASYGQLEQLAREQERVSERGRVLRDMHDGVGSHISAAIRQLQSGNARVDELMLTLRDSLDQLKLSVDALNLPQGDITALLASLRYRLEPRLKASGITLQWDVGFLEPLSGLDHRGMRQLQFMLLEAVSNVLQHSHANLVRFELHPMDNGGARLRVIDNGCGFDLDRVTARGLASLRERAAALGAGLRIASAPGQTLVEITLDG